MGKAFPTRAATNDAPSLDEVKHQVVSAARNMSNGDVLELADALHNVLRERRAAAADLEIVGPR